MECAHGPSKWKERISPLPQAQPAPTDYRMGRGELAHRPPGATRRYMKNSMYTIQPIMERTRMV
ncbi:protein of unknown function [Nitrospina watsonii]|uniref:Uncharacterized protein n=1 Tax=Nitrospina watsonii TaxID=1323948 RepID=A0ABM9HAD3_9BACT|nr:protein of unknown function [Nitrospina watsonii]